MSEEATGGNDGTGRELRNLPRVNYSKMNTAGFDESQGATGGVPAVSSQEISAAPPLKLESEGPDEEIRKLREEMKNLKEEEALLRKSEEVGRLKKELKEQKKTVEKLRGKNPSVKVESNKVTSFRESKTKTESDSKSSKTDTEATKSNSKADSEKKLSKKHKSAVQTDQSKEDSSDSEIDITALRKDEILRKLVRKELSNLGLDSYDSSSDSSISSSESTDDEYASAVSTNSKSKKNKKHKSKKHKKKSGISAKASDKVKTPQKWPHAHLQYEYVNKHVKFDELDFKLFIAGELEIISEEGISKAERSGRISMLKKIVYYSNTYDFKGLKSFYAAWLREIELGKKTWVDDPQQIESAILSKHLRWQKSSFLANKKDSSHKGNNSDEKLWFCSLYQRNKCANKASHMVVIKGKMRMAQHICATCWLKDKAKLAHPECSSSCPHTTD